MHTLIKALLFCLFVLPVRAQDHDRVIDSLKQILYSDANDTLKLAAAGGIANRYNELLPDSSLHYAELELSYARKLNFKMNEAYALGQKGYALLNIGNFPQSLQNLLLGKSIVEDPSIEKNEAPLRFLYGENIYSTKSIQFLRYDVMARLEQDMGILYGNALTDLQKEKHQYLIARELVEKTGNLFLQSIINGTLGRVYFSLHMLDSARITEEKAYELSLKVGNSKYHGSLSLTLARIYAASGDQAKAKEYFQKALVSSQESNYIRGVVAANLYLAELYNKSDLDSSLIFIKRATELSVHLNSTPLLIRSYRAMANYFRAAGPSDSTVKYQERIIKLSDSLFSVKQTQLFQSIDFEELQRQQKKEAEEKAYLDRLKMYALLAGLAIFIAVAIILWRGYVNKRRAIILLEKQKQETEIQRSKAESALSELKSAQTQLIQSEKMASLGELTAGIAHEIENPLNFVNNFSEVNAELLDELKQAIQEGKTTEALTIANDILSNQGKIISHGKRADDIVRNMLQHSRTSTGQKVPTDINALADEYLRLSYHGLRAKNKDFNATIESNLDKSVGQLKVIPQDISRVFLNLFNNAFYAVAEKQKKDSNGYIPSVTLTTKKIGDKVLIGIRDNGLGIRHSIKDKIFQPFFTTKPAGQGTGLGLSLSYDIVKAHGGDIQVESEEGQDTQFTVVLPV